MVLPFRLFSLEGCPRCIEARQFLNSNNVNGDEVASNQDPIIDQGVIKLTGAAQYPVLLARFMNPPEIIVGFKPEEYKRVVAAYHRIYSTGASSVLVDGKSVVVEPSVQSLAPSPTPSANTNATSTTA